MLTPQEVSERAFQKANFGGYNMAQVDEFLDILTGDYSALYNENAVLKNKMKVLVDKVEEYRSTEDAMRKALMAAQRMADDLIKEAERKKSEILLKTEAEVQARRNELSKELEAEEFRLKQAQQATAGFVDKVRSLHLKEAEYLSQLEELYPPETAPAGGKSRRDRRQRPAPAEPGHAGRHRRKPPGQGRGGGGGSRPVGHRRVHPRPSPGGR